MKHQYKITIKYQPCNYELKFKDDKGGEIIFIPKDSIKDINKRRN